MLSMLSPLTNPTRILPMHDFLWAMKRKSGVRGGDGGASERERERRKIAKHVTAGTQTKRGRVCGVGKKLKPGT